ASAALSPSLGNTARRWGPCIRPRYISDGYSSITLVEERGQEVRRDVAAADHRDGLRTFGQQVEGGVGEGAGALGHDLSGRREPGDGLTQIHLRDLQPGVDAVAEALVHRGAVGRGR